MRRLSTIALLFALAALTSLAGGCWSDDNRGGAAASDSYTVTVTGADVVNKDSGQPVAVGGMPLDGGTLDVN